MNDHLVTTPAVLASCTGCGSHILACHAGGLRTYADPESLPIDAEINARLNDLDAYDVIGWGAPRKLYLESRTLMRVKAGRDYPVVAEHRCRNPGVSKSTPGMELHAPWVKPEAKTKRKVTVNDNADFPF